MQCPYNILNLPTTATPTEVKARWRALAIQHHPDHGGDADDFNALRAAYAEAYNAALLTPCPQCLGSGERRVPGGFHTLTLPCDVCAGSGKRY